MTTSRAITDYGGVKADAAVVANPTTEAAASEWNRFTEDVAQMTRTTVKMRVSFLTSATAAPVTIDPADIIVTSHYGSGTLQKPVVTKTATGSYTITAGTSFTDALGVDEDVEFSDGHCAIRGTTFGHAQVNTIVSNVVTVLVTNTSDAASDLGGGTRVTAWLE